MRHRQWLAFSLDCSSSPHTRNLTVQPYAAPWNQSINQNVQSGLTFSKLILVWGKVLSSLPFCLRFMLTMWLAVVKKERYLHIILYADDILLLAPSVTQLERLLRKCEEELSYLDMVINVKKSACLRVGPRYNVRCREITTCTGSISWVNQMRYLGVFFVKSRVFKCDLDHVKFLLSSG